MGLSLSYGHVLVWEVRRAWWAELKCLDVTSHDSKLSIKSVPFIVIRECLLQRRSEPSEMSTVFLIVYQMFAFCRFVTAIVM